MPCIKRCGVLSSNNKSKNISRLSDDGVSEKLKNHGNRVAIIGLDFHTGFIVNDGKENRFIHCNYTGKPGVTKETMLNSTGLKSSKIRSIVSLTADNDAMQKWLNAQLSSEKNYCK